MKDNEYSRKEKVCPLAGEYCDRDDKDCDRCIAEKKEWEQKNNG